MIDQIGSLGGREIGEEEQTAMQFFASLLIGERFLLTAIKFIYSFSIEMIKSLYYKIFIFPNFISLLHFHH